MIRGRGGIRVRAGAGMSDASTSVLIANHLKHPRGLGPAAWTLRLFLRACITSAIGTVGFAMVSGKAADD